MRKRFITGQQAWKVSYFIFFLILSRPRSRYKLVQVLWNISFPSSFPQQTETQIQGQNKAGYKRSCHLSSVNTKHLVSYYIQKLLVTLLPFEIYNLIKYFQISFSLLYIILKLLRITIHPKHLCYEFPLD